MASTDTEQTYCRKQGHLCMKLKINDKKHRTFTYKKVEYEAIKSYRKLCLAQLSGLQELFIKWIVEKSNYYTINSNGKEIGYFIVSKQNSLVKFYVDTQNTDEVTKIFEEIYGTFHIENILCRSFDSILLKCCFNNNMKLFRDYIDTTPQDISEFAKIEFADESDYDNLVKYDNELYETEEDFKVHLKKQTCLEILHRQ